MEEEIIRQLLTAIRCGVCGHGFEISNVNFLGQQENVIFLQVVCSNCYTQCLVAVMLGANQNVKTITDLTEKEYDKFNGLEPLSSDEVLDMHAFLNEFDGDFKKIFGVPYS